MLTNDYGKILRKSIKGKNTAVGLGKLLNVYIHGTGTLGGRGKCAKCEKRKRKEGCKLLIREEKPDLQ